MVSEYDKYSEHTYVKTKENTTLMVLIGAYESSTLFRGLVVGGRINQIQDRYVQWAAIDER